MLRSLAMCLLAGKSVITKYPLAPEICNIGIPWNHEPTLLEAIIATCL